MVNRDGGDALFAALGLAGARRRAWRSRSSSWTTAPQPEERARIARESPAARVVAFSRNLGFAGAANEGIARTRAPFVLLLNNDAVLEPDYVARLAARLALDERLAAAQGLVLTAGRRAGRHGGSRLERPRARRCRVLAGADAVGRAARALRGLGRLGDGDAVPARGARGRRPAGRGLRRARSSRTTRTWTCRCACCARAGASPATRAPAPGTRARARAAARRSGARSGRRATAGGRSFATSTPRSSRRAPRPSCARTWRTCAPSAGRAPCCRCSSGRACRSWRCARGTSRAGSRNGRAAP